MRGSATGSGLTPGTGATVPGSAAAWGVGTAAEGGGMLLPAEPAATTCAGLSAGASTRVCQPQISSPATRPSARARKPRDGPQPAVGRGGLWSAGAGMALPREAQGRPG